MPIQLDRTVTFNQNELLKHTLPPKLKMCHAKFGGLCELICNKVLMKSLLGKGNGSFLKEKITINKLNKNKVADSHLLHVYSFVRKLLAFLFRVYPDNMFSFLEQLKLTYKSSDGSYSVNQVLLFDRLNKMKAGSTVKVELFKRELFQFTGHSTLVKKIGEHDFIFFDPNSGEHRELSEFGLAKMLNACMCQHDANDLFFLNGSSYLELLRKNNILSRA